MTEEGCFVYKVVHPSGSIGVRRAASTDPEYSTNRSFSAGDLVSIDLVQHGKGKDGPFLRLSDGSGWLFERKEGVEETILQKVEVETGMWSFYVDNAAAGGLVPRNHPIDQLQDANQGVDLCRQPKKVVRPMSKIFCDRKVQGRNGVKFYRVQGEGTASWVFDRRLDAITGQTEFTLIPQDIVRTGLFAFQANQCIAIRSQASVGNDCRTDRIVREHDIVVCDLVCESPFKMGNGPFLRLTDGTGWLFANKLGEEMMKEVPVEEGKWKLEILNPVGIKLRKQPIDNTQSCFFNVLDQGGVCVCDRRVQSWGSSGVTCYYRLQGTDGWIFDKRGQHAMVEVLSEEPKPSTPHVPDPFTIEYVRSKAGCVPGMSEVGLDTQSGVVSFWHPNGAQINVNYMTRTVGTALDHPNGGKSQLFWQECTEDELVEMLKNPRVAPAGSSAAAHDVDVEGDFRNRLLDLDAQIESLFLQKKTVWKSVRAREDARGDQEGKMRQLQIEHKQLLEEEALTRWY